MREILFRGKRIDNGEWVEGYLCKSVMHVETFHQNVVVDTIEVYDGESYLNIMFRNVSANSIGQYTGLKDRNGRKIFEGDIIALDDSTYVCCWDACNFEFSLKNEKESFGIAYAPLGLGVIGNIHDNPELLEVQE